MLLGAGLRDLLHFGVGSEAVAGAARITRAVRSEAVTAAARPTRDGAEAGGSDEGCHRRVVATLE